MATRPEYLPDFASPPLDEVVIGVQFAPPLGYSSVFAKDIWQIFKDEYPQLEEHQPLPPAFETFGGIQPRSNLQLQIGSATLYNRLWFITKELDHLIQFQPDRFLLNWRRRPNGQEYPRFEYIADSFKESFESLQAKLLDLFNHRVVINQAEVTYINLIPVESFSKPGEWFNFINHHDVDLENLLAQFSEIINNTNGKPYARLHHEIQSVVTLDGKIKAFKFALTFRGNPGGSGGVQDVIEFIRAGRSSIVTRFTNLTTETAHQLWKRKK